MKLKYFAWVRERIGKAEETVEPPPSVQTIEQLIGWLAGIPAALRIHPNSDQTAVGAVLRIARRPRPRAPKPTSIRAQLAGSGTVVAKPPVTVRTGKQSSHSQEPASRPLVSSGSTPPLVSGLANAAPARAVCEPAPMMLEE